MSQFSAASFKKKAEEVNSVSLEERMEKQASKFKTVFDAITKFAARGAYECQVSVNPAQFEDCVEVLQFFGFTTEEVVVEAPIPNIASKITLGKQLKVTWG